MPPSLWSIDAAIGSTKRQELRIRQRASLSRPSMNNASTTPALRIPQNTPKRPNLRKQMTKKRPALTSQPASSDTFETENGPIKTAKADMDRSATTTVPKLDREISDQPDLKSDNIKKHVPVLHLTNTMSMPQKSPEPPVPQLNNVGIKTGSRPHEFTSITKSDTLQMSERIAKNQNQSKASNKTEATVVTQQYDPSIALRPLSDRKELLQGPTISASVGQSRIFPIYQRAAMALSPKLKELCAARAEQTHFTLPESMDPEAVKTLLITFPRMMAENIGIVTVPFQGSFAKDVQILRAARLLGMEKHTSKLLFSYTSYLHSNIPSYEEIVIIVRLATSMKDPLWTKMVNHLCHLRNSGKLPDENEFETFLTGHPKLREAMQRADQYFERRALSRKRQS